MPFVVVQLFAGAELSPAEAASSSAVATSSSSAVERSFRVEFVVEEQPSLAELDSSSVAASLVDFEAFAVVETVAVVGIAVVAAVERALLQTLEHSRWVVAGEYLRLVARIVCSLQWDSLIQ